MTQNSHIRFCEVSTIVTICSEYIVVGGVGVYGGGGGGGGGTFICI